MFASILLQSSVNPTTVNMLMIGGMILVFYFFMVLPGKKKKKEQNAFLDGLKKGQTVVTAGGMHGKIVSIAEHTVSLEVDRGLKITFEKGSLSKDNSEMLKAGEAKS